MRLLGDWNWWLPRWLGWLPRVTIEVEDEPDDAATRGGAPAPDARPVESPSAR